MTKTYQSIRFSELHLTTLIKRKKGDEKMTIDFIGGSTYPLRANGTFTTNDKEIQDTLEKSNAFNKTFRLLFKDGKPVFKEESNLTLEDRLKGADKLNTLLTQQIHNFKEGIDNPLAEDLDELKEINEALLDNEKVHLATIKDHEKRISELKAALSPVREVKEEAEEVELEKAEGPINMQAARQYLIKKHGQDIKHMKNGQQVINVADKCGVVFPNWHPKS